MKTADADERLSRLHAAASALDLAASDAAAEKLLGFIELLVRWNGTYNLTSVRNPDEMLVHHLFDCMAIVAPLRRQLPEGPRRLLDVGSGGGLPGVVLAILLPELDVTCVDTVGKKAAFIRQAGAELSLPNLHAEHARVEALRAPAFDVICSRAFASLVDFTALSRPHLTTTGIWMAMKGKLPREEIASLPPDVDVFHVEPLTVPELAADRCLVWMRPAAGA